MSVKKNIIANYIGKGLLVLLSIVFIPIYIRYLGVESYGIIGFYTVLVSMMMLVDVGMGQTIIREVAKYTANVLSLNEIKDTIKTFKYIYFSIAIVIFTIIYFSSELIVLKWLKVESLQVEDTVVAIKIIAGMVFVNWLSILYRNSIIGLEYQVWLNVNDVGFALVSKVGVIVVLAFFSPTIIAFLFYQLIVSILQFFSMLVKLNIILPNTIYRANFSFSVVQRVWKFSFGVALTTAFGTLISQADKMILSTMLSLKTFGLYTIASVIGRALGNVISPITLAIRPKITILYESNNEKELIEFYHKSAQLMSIVSIPIGIILVLFSKDILWIWTNDMHIVEEISLIVSLLVVGTILNGMMHIPYSLQLSAGWSSLSAKSNMLLSFILIPSLIIAINMFGMIAAPLVWIIVNFVYIIVIISIMHKKLLVTEKWYWYKYDIFYILLVSIILGVLGRYFIQFDQDINKILMLIEIFILYIVMLIAAVISANKYRDNFINILRRIRND